MTERIQEAIDVFLDAINNGTLAKGDCSACAVGTLLAHGIKKAGVNINSTLWKYAFMTAIPSGKQKIDKDRFNDEIFKYSKFTPAELAKIEYAFETNTSIPDWNYVLHTPTEIKQDQIRGLHAVIEVMKGMDDVEFNTKEVFTDKVNIPEKVCI